MDAPVDIRWADLSDKGALASWNDLGKSPVWDSPFSEAGFLSAVTGQSESKIEQVTILMGERVVAAARVCVKGRLSISYSPVPRLTAFSALRFHDRIRESEIHARNSAFEHLLGAMERRFSAAVLHLPPAAQDVRVFTWRGWTVQPLYTYRIRLNADTDPLLAWSESARRIARHQASAFEIVETAADLQARLVVESYRRNHRRPPLGGDALTKIIQTLKYQGLLRTMGARSVDTGEVDASIALLLHDSSAYYWLAGSRPGVAMTALLARVLPDLAASGTTTFDFVGANTASIAEFKRKFGGQLAAYFRAVWKRGVAGHVAVRRI
jgi:hypothetical protein